MLIVQEVYFNLNIDPQPNRRVEALSCLCFKGAVCRNLCYQQIIKIMSRNIIYDIFVSLPPAFGTLILLRSKAALLAVKTTLTLGQCSELTIQTATCTAN